MATIEMLDALVLPRRDLVALAREYGLTRSTERVVRTTPLPPQLGTQTQFWVWDWNADRYYPTTATLRLALDHVLMYVEDGLEFDQTALDRSARDFNDRVYPRTREVFGSEWIPGIDGDPRITILNARIRGAGGYYSITDEVPRHVNRYSNEREMFYMNVENFPLGSEGYSRLLAHEFQHMIEWPQASVLETWLNEGLSELSVQLNGMRPSSNPQAYLDLPDIQLTAWGDEPNESGAHYAAAYLFMAYVHQRYAPALDLKRLMRDGAGKHLNRFGDHIRTLDSVTRSFDELFADWAVANLINEPDLAGGRWSYAQLPQAVQPVEPPATGVVSDVAQYGADYLRLASSQRRQVLLFDGSDTIGVVAARPQGVASWWSNRGDDAVSTLTGAFDLTGVTSATLRFRTWYDLQRDYDYGFVSVSTDNGTTWRTLAGRHTTTSDPAGANYGHGYTGISGAEHPEWLDEMVDLSSVAGHEVLIRFSTVIDDAVHHPGMLVDDIRIPELDFADDAEKGDGLWQAKGWVRTDNALPQRWQLRLVRTNSESNGDAARVEAIPTDADNRGKIELDAGARAVLVVMATTPHTTERARYSIAPAPTP